jgi:hypothetical protein
MPWYQAPLWDLRPDTISCRNVAVRNLRSCIYGAPSLTRGWVCNLRCNHSMARVAQNPKSYFTVSSETLPAWRARFPCLYTPGTGWPSYTLGHWVSFDGRQVKLEWSQRPLTANLVNYIMRATVARRNRFSDSSLIAIFVSQLRYKRITTGTVLTVVICTPLLVYN